MTFSLSFWVHFSSTCALYDFYDVIHDSHNSLISFLSLTLHMVWKVSTCGDLASFLTDSWLGTGLRSRVTQSQHFATSVQWASRLHTCCWERRFFQTRFLLSIGLLTTGRLVLLRSPFHSWHITGGQLWLLCLLCGGLFWYTLGVIFLFEEQFFRQF